MKSNVGFTLIEIIITLTVMAIAATMALTYTGGTSFTQSAVPAGQVSSQYKLIEQMELITSKYRDHLPKDGSTLDLCAFKTDHVDNLQIDGKSIVDTGNTVCPYILTGTSGDYTILLVTLTDGQQKLQTIFTN